MSDETKTSMNSNSTKIAEMSKHLGFTPLRAYGCIGGACTPLPEDSSPHEWAEGALCEQPAEITRQLLPHQLKSVADMERFEKKEEISLVSFLPDPCAPCTILYEHETLHNSSIGRKSNRKFRRLFGIQADPVGFGKTLSAIALIARDQMPWPLAEPLEIETSERRGFYEYSYTTNVVRVKPTLILASLSCVDQWLCDFTHAPNLKVGVVKSLKHAKAISQNLNDYDAVVTTDTMYKKLVKELPRVAWKRFIYDEPAHLRVSALTLPLSGFTWLITATPSGIEYAQGSCNWVGKLMSSLNRGRYSRQHTDSLKLFMVRNPTSFINASFKMPDTKEHVYVCAQRLARAMRGILSSDHLAQIQAGDVAGVIADLGGSRSSSANLVDVIRAKKLKFKNTIKWRLSREGMSAESKKQWQTRLDEVNRQLSMLKKVVQEELKESCPICLDEMTDPVLEPECGKLFCAACLLTWVSQHKSCPNCRCTVRGDSLVYISDKEEECKTSHAKKKKMPTAMECVATILKTRLAESPNAKFILASQYCNGYAGDGGKLEQILISLKVKFCKIKGATSTRAKQIKSFQTGDMQVIFLNHFENTAGVNLQAATDVLLYNDMSASLRAQIVGRANRIGRTQPLRVHSLKFK